MSIECLDKFVIYVAGKTTSWISLYYSLPCCTVTSWMLSLGTMSWISLILFPALLYCHLLNVELRHNVDGVPRQLCTLPTTPRFTCPHFPSLAFVPFPSASSICPSQIGNNKQHNFSLTHKETHKWSIHFHCSSFVPFLVAQIHGSAGVQRHGGGPDDACSHGQRALARRGGDVQFQRGAGNRCGSGSVMAMSCRKL